MTMCCKMMRLSSVSTACEEAVCSQQNLPPFFLSPNFSCLFLLPPPVHALPNKQERWQTAVQPSPLELSLVLQIPFLSTDIKYLNLL